MAIIRTSFGVVRREVHASQRLPFPGRRIGAKDMHCNASSFPVDGCRPQAQPVCSKTVRMCRHCLSLGDPPPRRRCSEFRRHYIPRARMRLQRMSFIDRRETDQGAPVPFQPKARRQSGTERDTVIRNAWLTAHSSD
jgi:hypothetical protein